MNYFTFKNYPNVIVHHKLFFRRKIIFPHGFGKELREQINTLADLKFTPEIEKHFHKTFSYKLLDGSTIPYFDSTYYQFLRSFQYKPEAQVVVHQFGSDIEIDIIGLEHEVMFYECQIMAIISELYFLMSGHKLPSDKILQERNELKFEGFSMHGARVSDFGLRRRYSKENHERVLLQFINQRQSALVGTSDVMFSRKFGIPAHGTMAHEIVMMIAGIMDSPLHANEIMLKQWSDTFNGALGTALTDTFTTDHFLKSFNLYYSKLFDGVRQDSGDPIEYTKKIIDHYKNFGMVLPNGMIPKTIIFSNAIDNTAIVGNIQRAVQDKIYSAFGIGTWLTNDVNAIPLNMVIKLVRVKANENSPWRFTVKIPDDMEKITGIDPETNERYKKQLNLI